MKRGNQSAGFVEIEHTADRAIEAWGSTPGELFEQAARGLFSLLSEEDAPGPLAYRQVELEVPDLETALVDWLNELLYLSEAEGEMFADFQVSLDGGKLHARVGGHAGRPTAAAVKAATYHGLRVQQDEAGVWRARIVFDT